MKMTEFMTILCLLTLIPSGGSAQVTRVSVPASPLTVVSGSLASAPRLQTAPPALGASLSASPIQPLATPALPVPNVAPVPAPVAVAKPALTGLESGAARFAQADRAGESTTADRGISASLFDAAAEKDDSSLNMSPAAPASAPTPETPDWKNNPASRIEIYGDGIMRPRAMQDTEAMVKLLKELGHAILDVQILARNGYGKILKTAIQHTPSFRINDEVLKGVTTTNVRVDGLFGGDSIQKIGEMARMLQTADQLIVDIRVTATNGYGKILAADIVHISKYKYDSIMGRSFRRALRS